MTRRELYNDTLATCSLVYDQHEAAAVAERFVRDLYGFGHFEVVMDGEAQLLEFDKCQFENALGRLRSGEPVQYIVGHTEFYGRKFKVRKGVLIPRPETEELVQWVLRECCSKKGCRILDVGTGSGAIAITLAAERNDAHVDALELSAVAASVAEENARANGVDVSVMRGDIFEFEPKEDSYDVIVSNPPYIPLPEREQMDSNVRDYEPSEALFVPAERPLIFYERIADVARVALSEGGWLCFEIHSPLAEQTVDMLCSKGFVDLLLRCDLNARPRMIICRKS